MSSRLLAAGLTLALHLSLGLAISGQWPREIAPLPPPLCVALCRLVDQVPGESKAPNATAAAAGDRSLPKEKEPSSRGAVKDLPRESEPPPLPPAIVPPSKKRPVKGRARVKSEPAKATDKALPPDAHRPAPTPVQQLSATPAVNQVSGPAVGRGEDGPAVRGNSAADTNVSGGKNSASDPSPRAVAESQPLYQETPKPAYPALARRMGYEGTVELEVLVKGEGTVGEARIARSCGYPLLDSSALEAVRAWRFEPGTRAGKKVAMWIKIPVNFSLR